MCISDEALRYISCPTACVAGSPGEQDHRSTVNSFTIAGTGLVSQSGMSGLSCTWKNSALPRRRQVSRRAAHCL